MNRCRKLGSLSTNNQHTARETELFYSGNDYRLRLRLVKYFPYSVPSIEIQYCSLKRSISFAIGRAIAVLTNNSVDVFEVSDDLILDMNPGLCCNTSTRVKLLFLNTFPAYAVNSARRSPLLQPWEPFHYNYAASVCFS